MPIRLALKNKITDFWIKNSSICYSLYWNYENLHTSCNYMLITFQNYLNSYVLVIAIGNYAVCGGIFQHVLWENDLKKINFGTK